MLDENLAGEVAPAEENDSAVIADDAPQTPASDELEEVEFEGRKYKIPKPLTGALMSQADHVRKAQEIAEQRKSLEERGKQLHDDLHNQQALLDDYAQLRALDAAIANFENANWAQIRAGDPKAFDQLWFQYQQTKLAKERSAAALQQKLNERSAHAQRENARRSEELRVQLARDIPDWSGEVATKVNAFAASLGFTPEEIAQVQDPRVFKALHAAWSGHQLQQKQAAQLRAAKAEAAKPLPMVSGNAGQALKPTDADSDNLSAEEWARRRNEQVRKRRK
jgi:hypothetical protein